MILQALDVLTIRLDGQVIQLEPGAIFTATSAQAARLLERAPGKLQAITLPPAEPLQPGWIVCYRDRAGRLAGGCDDRQGGTVQSCTWDGSTWTVRLTNVDTLPLRRILSVGKTDATGRIVAAWSVREHGYDGEGH
jgi:hypothetical protein